jgi:hypothetical protein
LLILVLLAAAAPPGHAFVYWADEAGSAIWRAPNPGGSGPIQVFVPATSPCAVAVDSSHIYWSNAGGSIGRASLDTVGNPSGANESFITGTGGSPFTAYNGSSCGLAVDSTHIYWVNDTLNSIGRANLDGSGATQTFITGASDPCGLAVDSAHIYWANASGATIGRANLDGTGPNADLIHTGNSPCGVAVDGNYVYWDNWGGTSIGRASLDGSDPNQGFINGPLYPCGVAVDSTRVYWIDLGDGWLGWASLDGATLMPHYAASHPEACGVAVDGRSLPQAPPPPYGPPPPLPGAHLPPPPLPAISHLAETNRIFAPEAASTPAFGMSAAAHRRGTTFLFTLNVPALVNIVIERRARSGADRPCPRRSGKVTGCTRLVRVAVLTRAARSGINHVHFTGRVNARTLRPGSYEAIFSARAAAGRSASHTLTFTVIAG